MTDPAIIQAAARVLQNECQKYLDDEEAPRLVTAILTAVTPLIEAAALERAAKLAEGVYCSSAQFVPAQIAAAIRALKEQP